MIPASSYVIGVDFGTLSARASVIRAGDGQTVSEAIRPYSLIEGRLPGGAVLPEQMALADPLEYRNALILSVKEAVLESRIAEDQIVGIAVDATSLSLVATDADSMPMSIHEKWRDNPHAYIKLWKSHSAREEADIIQSTAQREEHPLLAWCGGHVSCEWAYPKMLETYLHAPALFAQNAYFWDLCDWLTNLLCGQKTRNIGALCYKFHYGGGSLPDMAFWNRVRSGFGTALMGKLDGRILRWGERAGLLLPDMAEKMGLPAGIAVGCGSLDGHVSMTVLGLNKDGDAMITLGTSGVCTVVSRTCRPIQGICGTGMDGLIPGMCGYDSGQASIGDIFAWFVDNQVPPRYFDEAEKQGVPIHEHLTRLAFFHPPRPDDPVALDWWNGNRCPLGDLGLQGVMAGFSLRTSAEDLYRALVESTAFGLKWILDTYREQGVPVRRLRACGGIAGSNPRMMQCYADALGIPIEVSTLPNAAAAGAALTASVAAGCYATLAEAMDTVGIGALNRYEPRPLFTRAYEPLYRRYRRMAQEFGRPERNHTTGTPDGPMKG